MIQNLNNINTRTHKYGAISQPTTQIILSFIIQMSNVKQFDVFQKFDVQHSYQFHDPHSNVKLHVHYSNAKHQTV